MDSAPSLKHHPHALIFPMMSADEFDRLHADIEANGLIEPVLLYQDQILDGRHRYLAMRKIDPGFCPAAAPKCFKVYEGDDPLQEVISRNMHRRHLNESQRAMIAAKLSLATPGKNRWATGLSSPKVAKMLNVSLGHVNEAKRVIKTRPDDVPAIERGEKRVGRHSRDSTVISFEVPKDLGDRFRAYCERQGQSIYQAGAALIERALSADEAAGSPVKEPAPREQRKAPEGALEKYKTLLADYQQSKSFRQTGRDHNVSHHVVRKAVRELRDEAAQ